MSALTHWRNRRIVSRRKWTIVAAATAALASAVAPAGAEAGRLDYPRAKRITVHAARTAASLYDGHRVRFTGCIRTSRRRMVCTYEFRRGDADRPVWCDGLVRVQQARRGRAYRVRAPFPACA